MNPLPRNFALTWCALAVLAACGGEDSHDAAPSDVAALVSQAELGPVRATVRMAPPAPRFGERVRLEFEVVAGPGAALELPEFGVRVGHFRIRARELDGDTASGRLRYTISAEPERTGTNIGRLPTVPFRVVSGEGAGTERVLELPPFEVEVAGLPADRRPDLAELGAPLPAVALPAGRDGGRALWFAAAGVLVALAAGGTWWWRRGRGEGPEVELLDPETEAARAFEALLALDLAAQGRYAELFVRLTAIPRRYIERTTGIHAPEQTTEEFLRAAESGEAFAPERRRRLSTFLEAADLVKFAAQVPSAAEIDDAFAAGRSFCGLAPRDREVTA